MKKSIFFVCFMALLAIVGCKNNDDPKAVLSDFFDAISKKDFAKAKTFATPNSSKMLDELEKTGFNKPGDFNEVNKDSISFENTEIKGDTALIAVSPKKNPSEKMKYVLIKINNQWKVAFEKEVMFRELLEGLKTEAKETDYDTTKQNMEQSVTDTLK